MTTPAIRVEGLGKRYRLTQGQQREGYRTLRESLGGILTAPFRKQGSVEEFWALDDVSFEVQPGEVVGIIGRNGAGKSTLLKILSRITKPTRGHIDINGRVGSLLEVGTGFHPELTGRENVYLNGSILGMSRREITAKFDEIVAFAEVERFLDTPVKRYSSGMYVRLAFAVAAHLQPEILIVDEVLAVGDASFQQKCVRKMASLGKEGRSLLVVSHQLEIVKKICNKGIILDRGRVIRSDKIAPVLDYYQNKYSEETESQLEDLNRTGTGDARFAAITLMQSDSKVVSSITSGENLKVICKIESKKPIKKASIGIVLKMVDGTRLLTALSEEKGYELDFPKGESVIECEFERLPVRPGRKIIVELWLFDGDVIDMIEAAKVCDVVSGEACEHSPRSDLGNALSNYKWSFADQNIKISEF